VNENEKLFRMERLFTHSIIHSFKIENRKSYFNMRFGQKNTNFRSVAWRVALGCAMAVSLGGCSETIEPKPLTYSKLLTGETSKSWLLTTIQIIDDGNPPESLPANQIFDPCTSDDLYVFYAGEEKKFEAREGSTKCRPNDPDVYVEGNWSLVNASATLEFPLPILTGRTAVPFTIKQLNENALTVEYYFPDINASYRFVFAAQRGG
jgi:hypothetical protein